MSEFLVIVYTTYYISYFINFIGIVQNIILFLVFSRKVFEKRTIRFYSKTLAIFDSFVVFNFACGLSNLIVGRSPIHYSDTICKIYFFISMGISPIPGWILVAFSIDQVISISLTRRYEFFRKRWFQYVMIVVILFLHCLIYFEVVFETNIQPIHIGNETVPWCDTRTTILPLVYLGISVSVPLAIVSATTIYIMRALFKSRNQVLSTRPSGPTGSSIRRARDLMFGFNSAILNILFIIFSFPIIVFYLIPIPNVILSNILKSFGFVFFYSHFATHFWIYFTVNSIFRNEVLILFCIRKRN